MKRFRTTRRGVPEGMLERLDIWYLLIYVEDGEKRYEVFSSQEKARERMFEKLGDGIAAWVEERTGD